VAEGDSTIRRWWNMAKRNVQETYQLLEVAANALSDSAKGLLCFITADREQDLQELAILVARGLGGEEPLPIYVVQGNVKGEHGWPFSRLKVGSRIRLTDDGTMITECGGLILPQDRPIVLLVERFDCLEACDQRAYSHLVDGEGCDLGLHGRSVLIAGVAATSPGQVEPGSLSRGVVFRLGGER
jgi:hypothetical protein